MPEVSVWNRLNSFQKWLLRWLRRGVIPAGPLTIVLAGIVGVLCGVGASFFTRLIAFVGRWTVEPLLNASLENPLWKIGLCVCPAIGLVAVSWFTRRYAMEAQGHGVPEVITAIARHDGRIRPRVAVVKILASGVCLGTGGSMGREGPIVQIGAGLGSMFGQFFKLSSRNIKVLVAAGGAAGISATFHAPLAGVIFASEIILGSFAVESVTPIVIASVFANVAQSHVGDTGLGALYAHLHYQYQGAFEQLPMYVFLGLICGLAAVSFTKMVYATEDFGQRFLRRWWVQSLVFGAVVGLGGALYPRVPPTLSSAPQLEANGGHELLPPLFGVGDRVIDHSLRMETAAHDGSATSTPESQELAVVLNAEDMLAELWWLIPLAFLKPLMTSCTLGGGGSGGIFAPSLFIGATMGGAFGVACNLIIPNYSANPGVYAIVGMGAVVAGTTHGVLSAILIVYEMTDDYRIILPIMVAAGLASIVARFIDPESIYEKKLSRRGESVARSHHASALEDIMVRDVMVRDFPTVKHTDTVSTIVRVARENSHIESLPVMNEDGRLVGIIRPEDLHRVLDSDISPYLLNATDIALTSPISVSPDENLLEALRDFGARDVETLPVETKFGAQRRLVGLLLRSDVMERYREELLQRR